MIAGPRFDGDGHVDTYVMWRQHDVYYQALGIITNTCQEYVKLAHSLIGDPSQGWAFINSYDHRTFQHSHDILAAVWRFRYEGEVRQMKLPGFSTCRHYPCPWLMEGGELDLDRLWGGWNCPISDCMWLKEEAEPDLVGHWLRWLEKEVRSWKHSPHLIRYVVQILKNQNQPVGYRSEAALSCGLITRYSDVPWTEVVSFV